MAKKVFIYGNKVINDRIPDSSDVVTMLRQMNNEIETRSLSRGLTSESTERQVTRSKTATKNRTAAKSRTAQRAKTRSNKQNVARRVPFRARVVIHKNHRSQKGSSVDISTSGIFVKADKGVFGLGEAVNLLIKPTNNRASYNVVARVKRFCRGPMGHMGYGLEFVNIS